MWRRDACAQVPSTTTTSQPAAASDASASADADTNGRGGPPMVEAMADARISEKGIAPGDGNKISPRLLSLGRWHIGNRCVCGGRGGELLRGAVHSKAIYIHRETFHHFGVAALVWEAAHDESCFRGIGRHD